MAIYEHTNAVPLTDLFNRVSAESKDWGVAVVKRIYLRAMTNEAFLLAVRPVLQGVAEAHIVYDNDLSICILWQGKQGVVYKLLRNLVSTSLMRPGLAVEANVLVPFLDPAQKSAEIKALLVSEKTPAASSNAEFDAFEGEGGDEDMLGPVALRTSPEQTQLFQEASGQKPYRRQLHILVVEDQVFSQKLLCEILRGVRVRNNNESPLIDAVQSVAEAWKIFLKKAPDVVFIDLNLTDGSGHTLARAIKELDPQSQVIIVTANSFEEEMNVARQNNVDGFITKPYNKKQILDGITRYIEAAKPMKGLRRGNSGQF